jgi:hypothetical protein
MQQRQVGSWLAQHNFPHGLLFFTPSISTDPLRHKTQHIRHLIDIGVKIQAAYGSSKDVPVYSSAGVDAEHIFKVSGSKRRGCVSLEDGYAQHLHDLHSGRVSIAQTVTHTVPLTTDNNFFTHSSQPNSRFVLINSIKYGTYLETLFNGPNLSHLDTESMTASNRARKAVKFLFSLVRYIPVYLDYTCTFLNRVSHHVY